jgi:peptidyl-prolyl cis-trans isomerase D
MLKVMRKHAKYFYFLFFMIIISFIGWGVGTVDKKGVEIVAEVGKYKITAEEYWKTYDRIFRFYREIYKDKFDEEMEKKMNLKENVLNSMINERVLLIAAKEAGIDISDEELQESITHEPVFMKNGVFDKNVYLNRLRLNRMTPEAYESSKRQEVILNKMKHLIELSIDITDISSNVPQTSGNEQVVKTISEAMAKDMKEKAVKSYLEGLKKQIKIKVNKQLIA